MMNTRSKRKPMAEGTKLILFIIGVVLLFQAGVKISPAGGATLQPGRSVPTAGEMTTYLQQVHALAKQESAVVKASGQTVTKYGLVTQQHRMQLVAAKVQKVKAPTGLAEPHAAYVTSIRQEAALPCKPLWTRWTCAMSQSQPASITGAPR